MYYLNVEKNQKLVEVIDLPFCGALKCEST